MSETLVWINLPHACYGIVVVNERVTMAPPIARWMLGKHEREVAAWLRSKGAKFSVRPPNGSSDPAPRSRPG